MNLILGFASFLIAFLVVPYIGVLATRFGIVDNPGKKRKVHKRVTPLLGGVGIFISIGVVCVLVLFKSDLLTGGEVDLMHYIGLFFAMSILMIGGFIDDKYDLSARFQVVFPLLAASVAVLGGLGLEKVTNPFGGIVVLHSFEVTFLTTGIGDIGFIWPGSFLVFLWLIGMMYTTKILDGLDGLATGIGAVGVLIVLFLSSSVAFFQPDVAVLSSIILGAMLGFLYWNWHFAKVFLGEGGALLIGFLLGSLAVISGGKIVTLLLVMGVPIMDVIWAIARRIRSGKSIVSGDRRHLHHRLFDLGLSHGQVVVIYIVLAFVFGIMTLVLSSLAKLIALLILCIVMFGGAYLILSVEKKKTNRKH